MIAFRTWAFNVYVHILILWDTSDKRINIIRDDHNYMYNIFLCAISYHLYIFTKQYPMCYV